MIAIEHAHFHNVKLFIFMKTGSLIVLLCTFFAFSWASSPLKVEVSAKGAILMNAETGAVLWEKNGKMPLYPASTTKMITALYALEKKGDAWMSWLRLRTMLWRQFPLILGGQANGSIPLIDWNLGGRIWGLKPGKHCPFAL